MHGNPLNGTHLVTGLDPVADAFSGTVNSDVVNLEAWHWCLFTIFWGVGTTGTTTITIEACDDAVPTTTNAVAFNYRRYTSADTPGAITAATATGFTTTPGSSQRYECVINAQALAADGYGYARCVCVESVNAALVGGIHIRVFGPRYGQATPATAVA